MILYHFCAEHLLKSILNEGLTLGHIPIINKNSVELLPNYQWLTSNKIKTNQSWNTSYLIKYDRGAYRLTIEIPQNREKKLLNANQIKEIIPKSSHEIIDKWEGSKDWYVYHGNILASWIKGHHKTK